MAHSWGVAHVGGRILNVVVASLNSPCKSHKPSNAFPGRVEFGCATKSCGRGNSGGWGEAIGSRRRVWSVRSNNLRRRCSACYATLSVKTVNWKRAGYLDFIRRKLHTTVPEYFCCQSIFEVGVPENDVPLP